MLPSRLALSSSVLVRWWLMPRKTSIPQREKEICERLILVRRGLGLSREMFARKSGIQAAQTARYEHHRSPVLFSDALRICEAFGISIGWLAAGDGSPDGPFRIGKLVPDLRPAPRARLSAVYDNELKAVLKDAAVDAEKHLKILITGLQEIGEDVDLGKVKSSTERKKLERKLQMMWRVLRDEAEAELSRRDSIRSALSRPGLTSEFTSNTSEAMTAAIPPTWDELRSKVETLTAKRGAKTRLARLLGVTQQAVSEWVSGASAPSADNTLRLLQWVAAGGK